MVVLCVLLFLKIQFFQLKKKKFKTVEDYQKYFGIAIYEGERIFAKDNTF